MPGTQQVLLSQRKDKFGRQLKEPENGAGAGAGEGTGRSKVLNEKNLCRKRQGKAWGRGASQALTGTGSVGVGHKLRTREGKRDRIKGSRPEQALRQLHMTADLSVQQKPEEHLLELGTESRGHRGAGQVLVRKNDRKGL